MPDVAALTTSLAPGSCAVDLAKRVRWAFPALIPELTVRVRT
jgi:hypothetical protein